MEAGWFREFSVEGEADFERRLWNDVLNAFYEVYRHLPEGGLQEDLADMLAMEANEALGMLSTSEP